MDKKKYIYFFLGLILILGVFGLYKFRWDLTQEKRYTLSDSTIEVLKSVKNPMLIDVYLDGDFPAAFKQLQNETRFMLEEFRKVNPKINFNFIDPIETNMSDETLVAMGMPASQLSDMKEGKISQITMYPYASIKYNTYNSVVPLIISQSGLDGLDQLNKSIESLEYSFTSSIKDISLEQEKNIGFLVNQQELGKDQFQGFLQLALENYNIGPIIPENKSELTLADFPKLKKMDALVIAKPRKTFTDNEKLILDQYIMGGGKTLWLLDAVNAEMDSLMQAKKLMAYPVDLNMTDFFFNYGLRINPALVKDMKQSALIRIVTGEVSGNPQYSSFLWPYFPLGIADNNNPITKNINPVKFEFPTSIDTLGRKNISTKVLFESSNETVMKSVPDFVALSEIINADSLKSSQKFSSPKIYAVSLEGKFNSAYAGRSERNSFPNFKNSSSLSNKMIVVADGDIAKNQVWKGKALPLGEDFLTKQKYGNAQFLQNALDYLLDDSNLMALRNRNIEARLLDRQRIDEEKGFWQGVNLLLPLGILAALGAFFAWYRKRKFS